MSVCASKNPRSRPDGAQLGKQHCLMPKNAETPRSGSGKIPCKRMAAKARSRNAHIMQQRDAKPAPQAMLFVRSATPRRNGTGGAAAALAFASTAARQRAGLYSANRFIIQGARQKCKWRKKVFAWAGLPLRKFCAWFTQRMRPECPEWMFTDQQIYIPVCHTCLSGIHPGGIPGIDRQAHP